MGKGLGVRGAQSYILAKNKNIFITFSCHFPTKIGGKRFKEELKQDRPPFPTYDCATATAPCTTPLVFIPRVINDLASQTCGRIEREEEKFKSTPPFPSLFFGGGIKKEGTRGDENQPLLFLPSSSFLSRRRRLPHFAREMKN